ncbi:MAG: hypothetical protein CM1200mP34_0880 [Verrucomicrobiales bacterium]|nr:MAG: hypothetical protein CM1200mP34_0880 [Verrucomicrobiales bacterium]
MTKEAKRGDKGAAALVAIIEKIEPHPGDGKPAITCELSDDERAWQALFLLSAKPTLFVANLKDHELAKPIQPAPGQGARIRPEHHGCETVAISAQ